MTTRLSTAHGDVEARRLRNEVVEVIRKRRPDINLSATQTLDQLVRCAAKAGLILTIGEKP